MSQHSQYIRNNMENTLKVGILTYTKNDDGTWTRIVDEAAKQAIIEKLKEQE